MSISQLRCFSTSTTLNGANKMMNKILSGTRKQKKFKYSETPIVPVNNTFKSITNDGKKSVNVKRINALNKLFMGHITDLMSTGTSSNAFIGHGIEVNRVKMAPDFKQVKVYWLARASNVVENIDEILKSNAGALRHELSQLRIMGVVPKIEFVKDNHYTMLKLVDDKLSQADYGEDHVPIDNTSRLKQKLELLVNLETHIKEKIEILDQEELETIEEDEYETPEMPQNVLGFNHADIMQRVLKSMNKKTKPQNEELKNVFSNEVVNSNPVVYSSMRVQREAFKDFLNKRQLLKLKATKEEKTYRPEMDYYEEEWEKVHEQHIQKYDFHEYLADDTDFVTDIDNNDSKH